MFSFSQICPRYFWVVQLLTWNGGSEFVFTGACGPLEKIQGDAQSSRFVGANNCKNYMVYGCLW